MNNSDSNDNFIPKENVYGGIILSLQNAQIHLMAANDLFQKGFHQQSTPLGVLSYEESSKAQYLLDSLEKNKSISKQEWDKIKLHKFKLIQFEKSNLDGIQNNSEFEYNIYKKSRKKYLEIDLDISQKREIELRKLSLDILEKLKKLKEYCFYLDWNENKNHFEYYNVIKLEDRKALNYLSLVCAEDIFFRVNYLLDLYDNPLETKESEFYFDSKNNKLYREQNLQELEKRHSFKMLKKLHKSYNKNRKNNELLKRGFIVIQALF